MCYQMHRGKSLRGTSHSSDVPKVCRLTEKALESAVGQRQKHKRAKGDNRSRCPSRGSRPHRDVMDTRELLPLLREVGCAVPRPTVGRKNMGPDICRKLNGLARKQRLALEPMIAIALLDRFPKMPVICEMWS